MPSKRDFVGDEEAKRMIEELYDKGHGLADYVIEQVLGRQLSRDEREDLIQEGFLRLTIHVEKLKDKDADERLRYMYSTMRNVAIDEGRRRSKERMIERAQMMERVIPPATSLPPDVMYVMQQDIKEKNRRVELALQRLNERDRLILIEKYLKGMSDAELAERMGVEPQSVRTYVARAREKASKIYDEIQREEEESAGSKSGKKEGKDGIRKISPSGTTV